MCAVEVKTSAQRDLRSLSPGVFSRIDPVIHSLAENPRPRGVIKLQGFPLYRVRVGDYRMLYSIDDKSRQVIILRVKHRREVYRDD